MSWRVSDVSRVTLVVMLAIAPGMLSALAYATPPDPSWIRGIYDGGDFDDVVVQITSATAAAPAVAADARTIPCRAERLPQLVEAISLRLWGSDRVSRSPPAL